MSVTLPFILVENSRRDGRLRVVADRLLSELNERLSVRRRDTRRP
jgi:hypothetical protein